MGRLVARPGDASLFRRLRGGQPDRPDDGHRRRPSVLSGGNRARRRLGARTERRRRKALSHRRGARRQGRRLSPRRVRSRPAADPAGRLRRAPARVVRHGGEAARRTRLRAARRPLDWKDWRFTFNTACRGCHVSQISNDYDPATDSYRTDLGRAWNQLRDLPRPRRGACRGLSRRAGRKAARRSAHRADQARLQPCADQRAVRRLPRQGDADHRGFAPGDRFSDHFELAAYETPTSIRTDATSAKTTPTRPGRAVPASRRASSIAFTVIRRAAATSSPTRRTPTTPACPATPATSPTPPAIRIIPPATPGSRCVACHMPTTAFARMRRSDHSMLPPVPAASAAYGSPNACTNCHADRDAAWADAAVRGWYGRDYQAPLLDEAALIAAARRGDWSRLADMLADVDSPNANEVDRRPRYCGCCNPARTRESGGRFSKAAKSASPLVRAAAVEALAALPDQPAVDALVAAAADDSRLVRVRAAAALAGLPAEALRLTPEQAQAVKAATEEQFASLSVGPDLWTSQYNLGNDYLSRGDLPHAVAAFEAASRLDPSSAPPLVNAALAYSRLGRNDKAEAALAAALKLDPDNAAAKFNMGLLQAELGDAAAAERHLRAALRADPDDAGGGVQSRRAVGAGPPGGSARLSAPGGRGRSARAEIRLHIGVLHGERRRPPGRGASPARPAGAAPGLPTGGAAPRRDRTMARADAFGCAGGERAAGRGPTRAARRARPAPWPLPPTTPIRDAGRIVDALFPVAVDTPIPTGAARPCARAGRFRRRRRSGRASRPASSGRSRDGDGGNLKSITAKRDWPPLKPRCATSSTGWRAGRSPRAAWRCAWRRAAPRPPRRRRRNSLFSATAKPPARADAGARARAGGAGDAIAADPRRARRGGAMRRRRRRRPRRRRRARARRARPRSRRAAARPRSSPPRR